MRYLLPIIVFFIVALPAHAQRFPFSPPEIPSERIVVYSMAEAFRDAHTDMRSIPAEARCRYRYLARSPHYTDRQWLVRIKVVLGHLNKLSRASLVAFPEIVGKGNLLRVNIHDFGWQDVWDKLIPPHTVTAVIEDHWVEQGYTDHKGQWIVTKSFIKGKRTVQRPSEWTMVAPSSPKIVDDLYQWTGSYVGVVRADWWLNESAIEEGRTVGYYDWRGFAKREDYFAAVGFTERKVRRKVEAREAVNFSGVGRQPRAIVREGSEGGGFWKTFDFERATGAFDPLVVFGRDIEIAFGKADKAASEWLGLGPNDFIVEWLEDNKGIRQDVAPGFVGFDKRTKNSDPGIHVGLCMRCHFKGLHDIEPFYKNTYSHDARLGDPDPDRARLLQENYYQDMADLLSEDNAKYERAVRKATGWTITKFHAEWAEAFEEYENAKVDIAYAARELGYEDAMMVALKLKVYGDAYRLGKLTGGLHPSLAQFVREDGKIRLPVKNWEVAMPVLWNTLQTIRIETP